MIAKTFVQALTSEAVEARVGALLARAIEQCSPREDMLVARM